MLLLPVAGAGPAADLVQEPRLPLPYGGRAARCAARVRSRAPPETEIKVWDSTSEVRYLVVPDRPGGTEGMSEDELAALVTRDSMIGTGLARTSGE